MLSLLSFSLPPGKDDETRIHPQSLLNGFYRSNRINEAFSLSDSMKKSGIEPNLVIYNILIDYNCKNGDVDNALKFFNQMKEDKELQPDVVTYNTLVTALCNSGGDREAVGLLREMETKRIGFDVFTFTLLIDVFAKEGNLLEARELFNAMMIRVEPNVVTYNSLLNGLCIHGCLRQARETFESMVDGGCCRRSLVTYNTLINGVCKYGRVDDAVRLLHRMRCDGLEGDTITYNTLIHGFCKAGNLRAAKEVLGWMVNCGVATDFVTHCIVLHGLCVNGKVDDAVVRFEEMRSGEYVGIVAYNIMIHGLCKTDRVEEAWGLFCGLPGEGVKPDCTTYTTMMLGLCKNGPRREADELFRRMKDDGLICQLRPCRRRA